ncbi:hypothetical protein S40285_01711 [Stachybotrys chlorohalonatus IBT 40285]|uniref:Putative gamma-glutamylcyclotransferase n=1 Tax=Stachybotrys chlorohalonatus (strain IBT 40285) TaxID=1283841 RepID=A0A084QDW0_STAC4|nr:hypothetical protein S40285_01711 [Stachybotrys chlorohalonata IBT 40285]
MSGEHTAFFYGTLMAPEVFFSVCYNDPKPHEAIRNLHTFTPAVLEDYCRHRVQFADYPGIIPEKGHSVRGIYATGLTDANMQKLDYFEGSEYERRQVTVVLKKLEGEKEIDGESKKTSVYVFISPEHLEKGEWDFETFRKEKMQMWTRGDWSFSEDDKAVIGSAV